MEINKEKSEVFFFNTSQAAQRFLARTMGYRIGTFPSKYLGIMLNEHQYRAANWEPLIKKIRNKMENWTFRSLNAPSRLILLKAVLRAIPIYQISCQAIPKSISQKMVALFKKFLWQGTSKTRKWASISWEWLSRLSKDGGLGLRDPFVLNQVMGVKLWWRWTQGGQDLWKVIWERKYEAAGEPEARMRSQTEARGDKARLWEESWQQRERLIQKENLQAIHAFTSQAEVEVVGKFWKPGVGGYWRNWKQKEDWERAPETDRWQEYYKEMASRKVGRKTGPDILRWGTRIQGTFSITEGYYLKDKQNQQVETKKWKNLWKIKHWPKMSFFVWTMLHGRALT
eukprot:PITA_36608